MTDGERSEMWALLSVLADALVALADRVKEIEIYLADDEETPYAQA